MLSMVVVCTKCKGPEQFINEYNGVLANVKDEEDIAKKLKYVRKFKRYDRNIISEKALKIILRT